MTTQDTEKSEFLINQERIMKLRSEQDINIAERQKHSLVPAAQETPPTGGKYVVETQNLETGKTSYREITAAPAPAQRFHKPETPTLDELRQQLDELVADIKGAGIDYENVASNLDSYFAPQKKLEKEISELRSALAQTEQELAELRSHGTPAEG
jgi:chromosome segregation ATPase